MDFEGTPRYKFFMNKKRLIVICLAVAAGLLLAGLVATLQTRTLPSGDRTGDLIAVTDEAFGEPFTLTDHTGRTMTDKDFTGKYRLIYFGFTFCPAICPTELAKITTALTSMGDKGKLIQPLFITVDPERDTPAKMKDYISLFDPSIIGLSGTPGQIKSVLKGYKIYAAKRQEPNMSEYTMDHSTFIYLIAPDDRLLHIFKMDDTAQDMARIMTGWLDHEGAK
jgi:cytochrome oxidase Cu insertion factor (SCO1/SenC/PrrC family)